MPCRFYAYFRGRKRQEGDGMFTKSRKAVYTFATAGILGLGATAGFVGFGASAAYACDGGTCPGSAPGSETGQNISTGGTGLVNVNPVVCGNNVQVPVSASVLPVIPILSKAGSGPAGAFGNAACQNGAAGGSDAGTGG